jgi:hypothetical protein
VIKRLEQVAALVVAAGLAIVSYWLFFTLAQGGGINRPERSPRSKAASGLEQPLFAGAIVEGGHVGLDLLAAHRQSQLLAQADDAIEGPTGILQGLAEQGLGEAGVGADALVEGGGVG